MINYMTLKYRILYPKCYSLSEMKFFKNEKETFLALDSIKKVLCPFIGTYDLTMTWVD